MTISNNVTKKVYSGNGSSTVFAFNFYVRAAADLIVQLDVPGTGLVTKLLTTDYTLTGIDNPAGGNVTFVVAPPTGSSNVLIIRATALTQETDYIENDSFPAETHEKALDKLTLIVQEQKELLDRSVKVVANSATTADQLVASLLNAEISATASKNAAATSATNAANSATSASNSATSATNSATSATNSATSATASKDAAATSATNAATSATNAATSATNAATSATNAAASKDAAALSATNAATSETNALASKNAAATSATNAASSASAAAASSAGTANSYKNKIIGGDFGTNPWQRGVTFAAVASGAFVADRWRLNGYVTTAVLTGSRAADAPTAAQAGIYSKNCLSLEVTTADTVIAATDTLAILQVIEGFNAASFGFGQAGVRNITLSFWVKASKIGINCVSFRNSASDRNYIAEYTITTANTWEYKVITLPVDVTGAWLYENVAGVVVAFALAGGANFQGAANTWQAGNLFNTANQVNQLDAVGNNFKIDLVQLEAGSTATSFETRSYAQELDLCLYYTRVISANAVGKSFGSGFTDSTTVAIYPILFEPMRAAASVTFSAPASFSIRYKGGNAVAASAIAATVIDVDSFNVSVTASGLVAGEGVTLRAADATTKITISAEL